MAKRTPAKTDESKQTPYERVTGRIIEALEAGFIPWRRPWKTTVIDGKQVAGPINAVSNAAYRGINRVVLSLVGTTSGYNDPRWVTFKQAIDLGGSVRKGEKGTPIVFWKQSTWASENEDGEEVARSSMLCRTYVVFNVEQTENVRLKPLVLLTPSEEEKRFEAAERISLGMPNRPEVQYLKQDRAYYNVGLDVVILPLPEQFEGESSRYSTEFHELTHATAHPSRLNRPIGLAAFGSHDYGFEELVAEFGAAFLSAEAGMTTKWVQENEAAYIQHWLAVLRNDRALLVKAASAAQKASDYILGRAA